MSYDRRAAPRHSVPADLSAAVSGVAVRVLELSLVGAKVEHRERFGLASPELTLRWRGATETFSVRAARSEIVAREGSALIYHTGIRFPSVDSPSREFLEMILRDPASAPHRAEPPSSPSLETEKGSKDSLDDTWTREVQLLRAESDEHLRYAQFRLTPKGWEKEYVESGMQPEDGFTILRDRRDFDELQRTFEVADDDTRRMMRIALEALLLRPT